MELRVNDYVRTKNGIIGKIKIKNLIGYNDWTIDTLYYNDDEIIDDWTCGIKEYDVIKSSPNIIDLIEVGDYVNGSKVLDIAQAPKKAIYTEQETGGALIPILNNKIESIVTKEQFDNIKYEVK